MLLATEPSPTPAAPLRGGLVLRSGEWTPVPLQDGSPGTSASNLKEDPCVLTSAQVSLEPSIYTAVLAAAFGGVKIELSPGRQAKVHPFLIWLFCLPVVTVQVSAIMALRTDMALEEPFHDPESDKGRQLLRLKIVMVIIVYVLNFKMLLNSTQLILFMLNPLTTVEAYQPSLQQWVGPDRARSCWSSCCFSWLAMAPWPLLALLLNAGFIYSVCSDSMSVILDADTATDTVFNALAFTFIAELSRNWWDFLASILHLSSLNDFKFRLLQSDKVWQRDGTLTHQMQEKLCWPELTNLLIRWTHWKWAGEMFDSSRTFLSRGAGARRIETSVSLVLMYAIYKRQLLSLLLAIDTNILPAARDVCTYWRWHYGIGARNMLEYLPTIILRLVEKMYIISASDQLKLSVEEKLQGHCMDPRFARLDGFVRSIEDKYVHITLTFSVIMLAWLFGPSMWFIFHRFLLHKVAPPRDDALESIDEEQEEEIDELEAAMRRHAHRLEKLEADLEEVQQNLMKRPASSSLPWLC